jgi:stearoyl-CoA desaturase (Delta-9 desaturase)
VIVTGLVDLPWWGYIVVALALTHVTIAAVTIYLHRHQAHHGLDLHPAASHFFRFWLWLTTGMTTKGWVSVHRKHHAKCETVDDPHSPQVLGIKKVFWQGAEVYRVEARNPETLEKFGRGTPDDWLEHNVYTPHHIIGIGSMLVIDLVVFGPIGLSIWGVQMLWIPLFAAGVINGIGHYWGYRNFACEDASRNVVPWGIIIGGEELHNNHHAYASSAKLSSRWYEFDIGWLYIRILAALGLADIKKIAPKLRLDSSKAMCDMATLQAVITHRYDVLSNYAKSLKEICAQEFAHVKARATFPAVAELEISRKLKHWLHLDASSLPEAERTTFLQVLGSSKVLHTAYSMRQELAALWGRSNATREQLVKQLEDWCRKAEDSDIAPLQEFSRRLRSYG